MKKILRSVLVASLLAIVLGVTTLPGHSQPAVNWRTDKPAYAPGDSGTLTVTILNAGNPPVTVRNITIYYPWAGNDVNGKWVSNANITNNFSPPMVLAMSGNTNFSYTTPQFNIPSWWGINSQIQFGCNNSPTRFGQFSDCILLGTNVTNRYEATDFRITMAQAFYNPSSSSALSEWVPVAELIVLIIATAFLALIMIRLGSQTKKT